MTGSSLAESYFRKAEVRSKALCLFLEEEAYSDAIRQAQEATELVLKGLLRLIGVEPPKVHDVGRMVVDFAER